MTERAIQTALWIAKHKTHSLMCPCYTALDWWEADMFAVTKAGFAVEFEIKISVRDFKEDAGKKREVYDKELKDAGAKWPYREVLKHELLAKRYEHGPSRFYYVCPDGVLTTDMMPEWAGLLHYHPRRWRFSVEKEAPQLHRIPVRPCVISHLTGVFQWRYWNLRTSLKSGKVLTDSQNLESMAGITGGSPDDFQALDT